MWGFVSLGLVVYLLFCDQPVEFKLELLFVAAVFAIANGLNNISFRIKQLNEKKESKDEN